MMKMFGSLILFLAMQAAWLAPAQGAQANTLSLQVVATNPQNGAVDMEPPVAAKAETAATLTKDEVIRIAKDLARAEGIELKKYNMTDCHHEVVDKNDTWDAFFAENPFVGEKPVIWRVFFEEKPLITEKGEALFAPGGHFTVYIDDRTKAARLMRGK